MALCTECGNKVPLKSRFCGNCGTAVAVAAPQATGPVEASEAPTITAAVPPTGATTETTLVERLLGGDWTPPVLVAAPTLLVAAGLAAVTSITQLLVGQPSFLGVLFELTPRTTSGWFHSIPQQVAMAFGSPLFAKA